MPTYEYCCEHCGEFTAIRPVSARNMPCLCPQCGATAGRVIVSAPSLATMSATNRQAHARNERAAHAPRTSAEYKANQRHGPGCSCCSGAKSNTTVTAPGGEKAFPTKRPWMISH
ncbi:MAG: FmdB family zinc ribbon protein [Rhodocyclaceae bacterium]